MTKPAHLAPSLVGFLALVLERAGVREVRRQRVQRLIGKTARSRDAPQSPAVQPEPSPAAVPGAPSGAGAPGPASPSATTGPSSITGLPGIAGPSGITGPSSMEPAPFIPLSLAVKSRLPPIIPPSSMAGMMPAEPVREPGSTLPGPGPIFRRSAEPQEGMARSPQLMAEPAEAPSRPAFEGEARPGIRREAAPPAGARQAALVRLLDAHVERTIRREALLAEAALWRPSAHTSGLPQVPAYGTSGAAAPANEAAPTLQTLPPHPVPQAPAAPRAHAPHLPSPEWRPSWLSPAPGEGASGPAPAPTLAPAPASTLAPAPASTLAPAPAPAPPAALDQLREQLARILADDALRHGLDLKGE